MLLVAHELGPLEPLITRAVVVHDGRIAHDGAVPEPAGHHAEPGHDHVHPHASPEPARRDVGAVTLFQYDFMLRALIGALVIGLTAPALGIYLVQRRMSLIGDGIGHVALTGVGVGLLLDRSPVLTAVIVAAIGAVAIELIRERGRTSGDVALALLFYGGIAGGVLLVGLSGSNSEREPDDVPVRLAADHLDRRPGGDRGARRGWCWPRCCCCGRRCSRSATTRSTPGCPACRCARSTC